MGTLPNLRLRSPKLVHRGYLPCFDVGPSIHSCLGGTVDQVSGISKRVCLHAKNVQVFSRLQVARQVAVLRGGGIQSPHPFADLRELHDPGSSRAAELVDFVATIRLVAFGFGFVRAVTAYNSIRVE